MMNFLQISLTTKCNLACPTCPMAAYRNTDNAPFVLTNGRLLPWIRKYLSPHSWVIELTGGEPALYDGISDLLYALDSEGYRGLVKTNGLLPIPKTDNFIRVAAFHNLDRFPVYYDKILIVDKLEREAKEAYCKEHGIDYRVIGFNKENPDGATHGFDKVAYIDPHGHQVPCPSCPIQYEKQPDRYTIEYQRLKPGMCCGHCKAAIDAYRFLPDSWK